MIRHRSLVTPGIMLAVIVSLIQSSSLCAEAKPKAGTYRDNGVVIKKNADGSIETFDSSDGPVTTIPAGTSGASGGGSHSGSSTRNIGGVKVKKNADGSIETSDTVDSYESSASPDGGSSGSTSTSSRSSKSYTKSVGGVTVKKNADGSIETFDSASAPRATRTSGSAKVITTRKSSTSKTGARRTSGSPAKRSPSSGGGVHVRKNADGSIETWD